MADRFDNTLDLVAALRPAEPVYAIRPKALARASRSFLNCFPGDVLYAVKCNDHPLVLRALYDAGIRNYDVASLSEIRSVEALPGGTVLHYMHPVKPRHAVAEAYWVHGVRTFALDHPDELDKIMAETRGAEDITLVVRIEVQKAQAVFDLTGKFGARIAEAPALLKAARDTANRVGVTFHVGSQCLRPEAWSAAIAAAGRAAAEAGMQLDLIDVGGGFPIDYPGTGAPRLDRYFEAIGSAVRHLPLAPEATIACEPGRALVGDAASLILRVDARRDDRLYLNDGIYGGLSDMKHFGTLYPMRVLRADGTVGGPIGGFSLYGPTCDSFDSLPGPYVLPEDVREGDWIEFGQIGAYSNVLQTRFNGFHADRFVLVDDDPFAAGRDLDMVRAA